MLVSHQNPPDPNYGARRLQLRIMVFYVVNSYIAFRQGKLYEKGPEGCHSEPLEEKIMPEKLQDLPLKLVATGSLGYKGVSVDCYLFHDDDEGKVNLLLISDIHVRSASTMTSFLTD